MPSLSFGSILLVIVVSLFTAAAAVWDHRYRRIPNALTIPVFLAGWVYQGAFHGWQGMGQGTLGFALGFGMLFILWIIGGGGGGDVKLMGALSVWLGFHLTLLVVILSTLLVVVGSLSAMIIEGCRGSWKKELLERANREESAAAGTTGKKPSRRIMAYAVPIFVATWLVILWKLPTLP